MAMTVSYTPAARRDLTGFDRAATARIREAVHGYAARPDAFAGHVDVLARRAGYRLTVGPYRVLFSIERTGTEGLVVQSIVRASDDG